MHGRQRDAAKNMRRGGRIDACPGHDGDAPVGDIMGPLEIGNALQGTGCAA